MGDSAVLPKIIIRLSGNLFFGRKFLFSVVDLSCLSCYLLYLTNDFSDFMGQFQKIGDRGGGSRTFCQKIKIKCNINEIQSEHHYYLCNIYMEK